MVPTVFMEFLALALNALQGVNMPHFLFVLANVVGYLFIGYLILLGFRFFDEPEFSKSIDEPIGEGGEVLLLIFLLWPVFIIAYTIFFSHRKLSSYNFRGFRRKIFFLGDPEGVKRRKEDLARR